jgi:hypothetical protein
MIIDSTNIRDTRELYSQTPPDFSKHNYYLNTLQMKIDADWPYRPNRKWVEEELEAGSEVYKPLEVVIQTVKNDKGETISDDWYRLVFRDCQKAVKIGRRYRFAYDPNILVPDMQKNIWLAVNQTQLTPTASQTVCRCNGTIGSLYKDDNGNITRHYEPVVQPDKLSGAGIKQSEVAVDLNGNKVLLAQFNKYTKQYYINQRFFIDANAADREHQPVYKITNIVRSNTLTTYDPTDVGLVRIYYEVDQIGAQDDVENRIAFNGIVNDNIAPKTDEPISGGEDSSDDYTFSIVDPEIIPKVLTTLVFKPELQKNGSVVENANIGVSCKLSGTSYADTVPIENFVTIEMNSDGTYTLTRVKKDLTMTLITTCEATTPNGGVYQISFSMRLFD